MTESRPTPRWVPILAVATILALAALMAGPERVLKLARGVVPSERTLRDLPAAAGWSLARMTAAYLVSLAFGWATGYAAATRPAAARFILPLLDVGQSVPVLGFFPAAIAVCLGLLGGGRFALELAAIFLIFTSQTWNLAFAVYEGLTTIPAEVRAAIDSLGVRGVLLWRALYVPACVPTLVYNSILSWANGWYFLIACEIIVAGRAEYDLPGLGSMLSQALARGDLPLATAALVTLVAMVVALELAVWRSVRAWSQRFRYDMASPAAEASGRAWGWLRWPLAVLAALAGGAAVWAVVRALLPPWPAEAARLPLALLLSFLRINAAYGLALLWIIPVTLWASDRPARVRPLSLVAQIGASIPATAFFPVLVAIFVGSLGGMELISVLLALTGMQWYLLFNMLAGVQRVPDDLRESMRALGLTRRQIHRKLVLPACMPSLVTGSVVAWGGTWNALILSEYIVYRGHTYEVLGVGALLNRATFQTGDRTLLLLSVAALVTTVVAFNRLVWKRAYDHVQTRYRMEA